MEQKNTNGYLAQYKARIQKTWEKTSKHPLSLEQVITQARELKMLANTSKSRVIGRSVFDNE